MTHEIGDIFPVFDPITEELLYHKPRHLVHNDGDWHRGVQANIIRPNRQHTFDILLQERSAIVDIGAHRYDQSLATQMLDKDHGERDAALKRGLASELGVTACRAARLPLNLRIVKTYKEQPGVLNRELVDLYLVAVEDEAQITSASPKITHLQWMDWHKFLSLVNAEPDRFTKTGRFYFSDEILLPFIEASSYAFLFNQEPPAPPNSAILHVDRWPGSKTTFRGQIGDILRQSGEVIYG